MPQQPTLAQTGTPRMRAATNEERGWQVLGDWFDEVLKQPVVRAAGAVADLVDQGIRGNTREDPNWKIGAMVNPPSIGVVGTTRFPMDEASRLARARQLGYKTDAYHGTQSPVDFTEFSSGPVYDEMGELRVGGSGQDLTAYMGPHFAKEPSVANKFAENKGATWLESRYVDQPKPRVLPVKLRGRFKTGVSDADLQADALAGKSNHPEVEEVINRKADDLGIEPDELYSKYDEDASFRHEVNGEAIDNTSRYDEPDWEIAQDLAHQYVEALKRKGYSGIAYQNTVEGGTSYVVFDPKNVRSRFAAFDPSQKNSANILASIVGLYAGAKAAQPTISAVGTSRRQSR